MADLLGPADAPFAVTVRPADTRVFPAADTFFNDCSAPGAGDGTRIGAAMLNGLLQQIRRAIRGQGVTENNADDDMLLKAIQAIAGVSVPVADGRSYNPVYPDVQASNGLLGVTGSTGQVVVTSGNIFVHRGLFPVNTADYSAPSRTFATAANKAYHLRWRYNGGAPAFTLFDVADPTYNPSALASGDPSFYTSLDDMLVAYVTTNGSNSPTIAMVVNKARVGGSGYMVDGQHPGYWRLPGGLIVQWGEVLGVNDNPIAITFPIVFPTAPLFCLIIDAGTYLAGVRSWNVTALSVSGATGTSSAALGTGTNGGYRFFALGF